MNKLVLLLICFCTVSSLADDLSQDELYYDIFSGVVYDTDQSLNDLFDMQDASCEGLHTGIVEDTLTSRYKLVFSGSKNALDCFKSKDKFNTLFNYTSGVNETQCVYARIEEDMTGFYPVDSTTDSSVMVVDFYRSKGGFEIVDSTRTMGPLADARNAYVFFGKKHNSQFCMESHGDYKFDVSDSLSLRSSGDTWVFVNGKLVIDLGGKNLDTTVNLSLKSLNEKFGNDFLVENELYTVSFFSCYRGTENIFFVKRMFANSWVPGMHYQKGTKSCYHIPASCESIVNGWMFVELCELQIDFPDPLSIEYYLETTDSSFVVKLKNGEVNYGGIDLTDLNRPKYNPDVIQGLEPGKYRLHIRIGKDDVYTDSFVIGSSALSSLTLVRNYRIVVVGLNLHLLTPKASLYRLFDMQGRVLAYGKTNGNELTIRLPHKGAFLLSVGSRLHRIMVR